MAANISDDYFTTTTGDVVVLQNVRFWNCVLTAEEREVLMPRQYDFENTRPAPYCWMQED